MLKQLSYALAAAALMGTTLASCSSDEPDLLNADGNVTFSVQLPADMATRATDTGSGLSATQLTAAVYQTQNGTTTCVDTKTATFANLTSQVEFQLVKGASYKIVFFADAQTNSPYNFDTNTGTMTVTYPNSYAETNDCFYKAIDVNINAGYTGEAVTLTRPVAQLNLGTDDLTQALAAGVYPNGVTVKSTVKGVANSLNMLTGEATGTVNAESTATMNDTYSGLNFPNEPATYKYLAMGYYLLPGQVSGTTTSGTYDCEFQLMNGTTNIGSPIISAATPMQANYRTNIYGALLSTGVIYNVTIDPIFAGANNQSITHVSNATDLAAALTNGGNIVVDAPITTPVDLTNLTKPVTLYLNAKVNRINLRTASATPVQRTIIVGNGVEYPTFDTPSTTAETMTKWTDDNYLANVTLEGTPGSSVKCHGFNFSMACPKNPATGQYIGWSSYKGINNVEFKNIDFDDTAIPEDVSGVIFFQNALDPNVNPVFENVRVVGCDFDMTNKVAIYIQRNDNTVAAEYEIKNIVIDNNKVTYPAGVSGNNSGLYLQLISTGLTVTNNVVTNAPYNGIFITCAGETYVANNRVITPSGKDCIKVQTHESKPITGNVTVINNYVEPKKNGIRLTDFSSNGTMTITGNTVNVANLVADYSTFHGIYLDNVSGNPLFIVKDNIKQGTANDAYWFGTTGSTLTNTGNQISNPY